MPSHRVNMPTPTAPFRALAGPLVLLAGSALPAQDLEPLLARVGSELGLMQSWDAAAAAARETDRPVLLVVHEYRSFAIPSYKLLHGLCDIDVLRLVRSRFVPLRYTPAMRAPLRRGDGEEYGMGPATLGAALLVVTPDGEVVSETHATDAFFVYDFLRSALDGLPAATGLDAPSGPSPAAEAARLLARGEHDAAGEAIGEADGVAEHMVLAGLRRRQRRGADALEHLAAARAAAGGDGLLAEADLAELVVQLRLGDFAAAVRSARALAARGSPIAEAPAVRYWSALAAICDGDRDGGLGVLAGLAADHPQDRWAWQGAVVLAACREDPDARLHVTWPPEEVLASLATPPPAGATAGPTEVARDAVTFLQRQQRADGSWISPSELATRRQDHPFTIAITALAGQSLLERRDTSGNSAAAARAMDFVLRQHEAAKEGAPPKRSFMDYTVWSETMALSFLADCVDAELGDASSLRAVMAEKVAALFDKQRPVGGFSYYVTNDLRNAATARVPDEAMSFTTAAAVLALLRCRDAGVDVDAVRLDRAVDALERARREDGAFAYMIGKTGGGADGPRGAAGRGPVCELALLAAGHADLDDVRRALGIFREHRAGLDRELGKALMHCGAQGQGCHYLFFDYATAAAAAATLPAAERARHAEWLLELILPARSIEGGFRDTPINGWPFGTAMALMAMHDLQVR